MTDKRRHTDYSRCGKCNGYSPIEVDGRCGWCGCRKPAGLPRYPSRWGAH